MEQVYSTASIQMNTEKEGYAKHNKIFFLLQFVFFSLFLKKFFFIVRTQNLLIKIKNII